MSLISQFVTGNVASASYSVTAAATSGSTNTLLLANMISALSSSQVSTTTGSSRYTFTPASPPHTNLITPITVDGVNVHFEMDVPGQFMIIGRTKNNTNVTEFIYANNRNEAKTSFLSLHAEETFYHIFIVREEEP